MTGLGTKLAAANYSTAFFGKWDVGMATPDHSPHGRGYHTAINYFWHDNDYWSMVYQKRCNGTAMVDLWHTMSNDFMKPEGPATGFNSTCASPSMEPPGGCPHWCRPGPRGDKWWRGYEDALFEHHVIETVERHNASDRTRPLFISWAPHGVHEPLQAPQAYIDRFDFIAPTDQVGGERQKMKAMINFADDAVGNVTAALRAKGMWENTLVVFMSDNGGWVSNNGSAGGNNYPLMGGKYNNWEGKLLFYLHIIMCMPWRHHRRY